MMFDSVYSFARGLNQFFKSVHNLVELHSANSRMQPQYSSVNPTTTMLNSFASCSNETSWNNGLTLFNYIDSVFNSIFQIMIILIHFLILVNFSWNYRAGYV